MYSHETLTKELTDQIDALIAAGSVVKPDWVATAVIANHEQPDGEDGDFWVYCGQRFVRAEAATRIGKYDLKPTRGVDRQLVLEGFERVQKMYVVTRDNEQVGVPVHAATDEELYAKAEELGIMGAGCFQHKDELLRYIEDRRQQRVA